MSDRAADDVELAQIVALAATVPLPDALAAIESRLGAVLHDLDAWLWDHQHRHVRPLRPAAERADELAVSSPSDLDLLSVPLVNLGDEIGHLAARAAPTTDDDLVVAWLRRIAPLVALAARSHAGQVDTIPVRRRRREMSLPAEIQWSLLGPTAFRTGDIAVSAAVEPAYDTGGDVFDYAVDGDVLHLAVMDAMGHGLRAAQVSVLATGALRRARRNGASLVEAATEIDVALRAQWAGQAFVSAMLGQLDLGTGALRWLTAGHEPPALADPAGVTELPLRPCLPLGLAIDGRTSGPVEQETTLAPGRTLVVHSDGLPENLATAIDGRPVGRDRVRSLVLDELASPNPDARRVVDAVLAMTGDRLRDDATLLLVTRNA